MISEIKLKNDMGIILQAGILISIALVLLGGCWFLYLHGDETFTTVIAHPPYAAITPVKIINLGLYILVAAQILRVALLCLYYTLIFDEWFMFFSYFILFVILYSF